MVAFWRRPRQQLRPWWQRTLRSAAESPACILHSLRKNRFKEWIIKIHSTQLVSAATTWLCLILLPLQKEVPICLVPTGCRYTRGWMPITWLTHVSVVFFDATPGVLFDQCFHQTPRLLPVADVWRNSGKQQTNPMFNSDFVSLREPFLHYILPFFFQTSHADHQQHYTELWTSVDTF